jgi:Ni/Fe-hydrogenase subunit HybB-like protein
MERETGEMKQDLSLQEKIISDLTPRPFGKAGKLWIAVLVILIVTGLFFFVKQIMMGLSVTAMRDYTTWGIYVSNFVFFVAISLVGSLISAILKLTNAQWRTPLTRISEIIAVAAISFAALVIIIDMGRPDRFLNVIFHARLQSPITWDVIVIMTYLVISLLLLYIPMLPDLAMLRDSKENLPIWQRNMYRILSMGWKGSQKQNDILKNSELRLSVLIIPVAFGIHTVTSWLFATTLRPGYDSTNFGPYFVSGAFMVGAGAVVTAMYIFRKYFNLKEYFTDQLFNHMGKLLVLLSLVYLYFNINEYFIPAYKMKAHEADHIKELFYGHFAPLFWSVQIGGMILPIVVLLFRKGRKPFPMFLVSLLVVVGAWFKRFLIVVPTLSEPLIPMHRVPESWKHYFPTVAEWSITIGTLAGALLIVTLLVRYFPIVPIVQTINEKQKEQYQTSIS